MNYRIEKDALGKIKKLFAREGVRFAYLFGSRASKRETKGSDFDFAIFLTSNSKEKRFSSRLRIIKELEEFFSPAPVDVVVLNDVRSLTLQYEIATGGRLIYEKDPGKRIDFELFTLREYEDFSPFLKAYNQMYIKSSS